MPTKTQKTTKGRISKTRKSHIIIDRLFIKDKFFCHPRLGYPAVADADSVDQPNSVARHGGDRLRLLGGRVTIEAKEESRILDFPSKQRSLDRLGSPRPCLCARGAPSGAGLFEHSRRAQKPAGFREVELLSLDA